MKSTDKKEAYITFEFVDGEGLFIACNFPKNDKACGYFGPYIKFEDAVARAKEQAVKGGELL